MPKADFSETQINFYTPVGSSLELTEQRAQQVDAALRELPEVQYTVATINSGQAAGKIYGTIYVRLVDRKDRKRSIDAAGRAAARAARAHPRHHRHQHRRRPTWAAARACSSRSRAPTSPSSSGCRPGASAEAARRSPAWSTWTARSSPTSRRSRSRSSATPLPTPALNVNALASTLRTLVAGTTVGNWRAPDGENYDVNVRLAPGSRDCAGRPAAPADHRGRRPPTARRAWCACRRWPRSRPRTGPNQINRRDLNREINIDANALGRSSGDVSADIRKVLDAVAWPPGYRYSLRRLDQEHERVVQLRHRRAGAGGGVHLHDPGQPVQELPAAAGADELAAADADRRGAGAADVPLDAQHVQHHRHRDADGPGDQERDPAGRLRDPLARSGEHGERADGPRGRPCCTPPRCGCARS